VDTAFYTVGCLAITLLAFLALKPFDKRLAYGFGLLFVAYVVLDDFITGLPYTTEIFDLNPAQWNWAGKAYSILLSAAVIAGFGMTARATGLVLPLRNLGAGIIASILLIPLGVVLALAFRPDPPSAETLAFQLLMPGLAEELAFRGIAPALLLGLIRGKDPGPKTPWVVVCIAAVPFGVVHGLGYANGAYSFDLVPALWTFSGGIVYGWLRFTTGSLLFPLLSHGLTNVAFHLTPLMLARAAGS
jgi:membrane protease YdiL (CAAX protease family)